MLSSIKVKPRGTEEVFGRKIIQTNGMKRAELVMAELYLTTATSATTTDGRRMEGEIEIGRDSDIQCVEVGCVYVCVCDRCSCVYDLYLLPVCLLIHAFLPLPKTLL